jgi:acetyltransferase-like isoleucine patch superfamily enzyme
LYCTKNIIIYKGAIIKETEFGGYNMVNEKSIMVKSKIGICSYIGKGCQLCETNIGKFCSIASNVSTYFGNHPTSIFVSTFPSFYFDTTSILGYTFYNLDKPLFDLYKKTDSGYVVDIGNDVWIGDGVKIMDGIKVGNGAIIAAGAVVTKDIPPYAIVGGIPAKIIKYRFSPDNIIYLQQLKWWDMDIRWIIKNKNLFENIDLLKTELAINNVK